VPERARQPPCDLDLGDLGAALVAEPLGALVALGLGRMPERVDRRLEQRPAQVFRPVLGERAAAVAVAGLDDARAEAGLARQLGRAVSRPRKPSSTAPELAKRATRMSQRFTIRFR
jgi:hypothetical protein